MICTGQTGTSINSPCTPEFQHTAAGWDRRDHNCWGIRPPIEQYLCKSSVFQWDKLSYLKYCCVERSLLHLTTAISCSTVEVDLVAKFRNSSAHVAQLLTTCSCLLRAKVAGIALATYTHTSSGPPITVVGYQKWCAYNLRHFACCRNEGDWSVLHCFNCVHSSRCVLSFAYFTFTTQVHQLFLLHKCVLLLMQLFYCVHGHYIAAFCVAW